MERLSDRDLRAVLSFLRETYGQPDLDTFAGRAVERLTVVVGAQRVSYNEMHRNGGTVRALIRPADDLPRLSARQARDHSMLQRFIRTGDGRAYKFSDFLTRDQFHATEMYQELYRQTGVEYQMTICLGTPSPHTVGFALSRDRLDFSERDRLALNLLRPHLASAYDQASAAARMNTRMALLGRAAETAEAGIVLVSPEGRIEFSTRTARHWLREYFGRRGRPSSRLPAAVLDWLRWQAARSAPEQLASPPAHLVVERDGRQLTIRAVDDPTPGALLLEERGVAPRPAALAPLGLTGRESEVLSLAARGASNEAIGHALGAKPRTVAKHIERIHRKLGVDSRAAAAARAHEVWASPRRLSE